MLRIIDEKIQIGCNCGSLSCCRDRESGDENREMTTETLMLSVISELNSSYR